MLAHITRRRIFWFVFVAIIVLLLVPLLLAHPPNQGPPIGTWSGRTDDGSTLSMTMTEDGGFYLKGTATETLRGVWTWNPVTSDTGIVTCQPADWPSHRPASYYVIWQDPDRIELSNFYFRAVLQRMF